jgi:hypothetical protein
LRFQSDEKSWWTARATHVTFGTEVCYKHTHKLCVMYVLSYMVTMRNFAWTFDMFNTDCTKYVSINKLIILRKNIMKQQQWHVHVYNPKSIKYESKIWTLPHISSFSFRSITNCVFGDSPFICPWNVTTIRKARNMIRLKNVAHTGLIKNAHKISVKNPLNFGVYRILQY